MLTLWTILKIALWALLGSAVLFFGHAAVTGFLEGLGFKRRPKFRVVGLDDEKEKEDR